MLRFSVRRAFRASACPARLYTRRMMRFLRGLEMPNYITLGNWTEQGIKTVKESPKRADAVAALANKLGAKMQIFYTIGRDDIVALTAAPNDDVAMQLLVAIGQLGNGKTPLHE